MATQPSSPGLDSLMYCSMTSPDPSKCFAASVVEQKPTVVLDTTEASTVLLLVSIFVFVSAAAHICQLQLIEAAIERLVRKAFRYAERTRPVINLPATFLMATALTAVFHWQVHSNYNRYDWPVWARAFWYDGYVLWQSFLTFMMLNKALFVVLLPLAATELLSS